MRTIARLATIFALTLSAGLAVTPPATAAAQWCNGIVVEDNGHTAGIHCWWGPNYSTQWRTQAKFCGPSGCFWAYGPWKTYGDLGRSKAHSDYATYNGELYINVR